MGRADEILFINGRIGHEGHQCPYIQYIIWGGGRKYKLSGVTIKLEKNAGERETIITQVLQEYFRSIDVPTVF